MLPSLLKERQGVVLVLPLGALLPGGRLPLRLDPGDTDDLHQGSNEWWNNYRVSQNIGPTLFFVIFSGSRAHTEELLTFIQQPWKFAT